MFQIIVLQLVVQLENLKKKNMNLLTIRNIIIMLILTTSPFINFKINRR